jgi:hypothetical protein
MNISKFTAKVSSMHTRNAWVQLKEGRNRFRFLCQNSEEDPWVETYRHFIPKEFTVENFPRVPLCLGTDCPACALVEEFRKRGNERVADMLRAQHRFVWPVFFRDSPLNEVGDLCIKLYEMPQSVFTGLGKVYEEWGVDFTDPDKGYDIEVLKTNAGTFTKYEVRAVTQREKGSMSLLETPLTEEERYLVANAYPDLSQELALPDRETYTRVMASLLDEPDLFIPGRSTPSTDPNQCPQFGIGYNPELDVCIECADAEECKEELSKSARSPRKMGGA